MPVHKIVIKLGAYTLELVLAAFEPSDGDSFIDAILTETGEVVSTGRLAVEMFAVASAIEVKL